MNRSTELAHYGVKGMKWGVRKNREYKRKKSISSGKKLYKQGETIKRTLAKGYLRSTAITSATNFVSRALDRKGNSIAADTIVIGRKVTNIILGSKDLSKVKQMYDYRKSRQG